MATQDKDFKVKNGLIVGNSTNLVNYTSASPSNPFQGQLWIDEPYLYAWSGSAWTLIGDGNSGGPGGSASGTPFNRPNTLVARSASGTFSISAIDLDITASPALSVGRIQWNPNFGTPEVGLVGGNVTAHIGQHVHAYVSNAEGSPLVKGDVVYLYGASGDRASVKKASNTSDTTSSKTLGVAAEAIGTGQNGFVTVFGVVDRLNLSDYSPGDVLWLSSSAGKFTNIKPSAPQHLVFIGVVARANPGNGQLFVNVQNGYELEELHSVTLTNVTDNDILAYNGSSSLWFNQNLAVAIQEVDGSGSGIDADLLDGQDSLYFQDAAGASATYLKQSDAASAYIKVTSSAAIVAGYIPISASYQTFDADKLDGFDSSYFLNTSSAAQETWGNFTFHDTVTIGNLNITGSATYISTIDLEVTDSIIYLAAQQFDQDALDIGIYGAYGDIGSGNTGSVHYHTGLIRDASDGKWKLFSKGQEPVINLVDFTSVTYDILKLGGIEVSSSALVSSLNSDMLDGYHADYFLPASSSANYFPKPSGSALVRFDYVSASFSNSIIIGSLTAGLTSTNNITGGMAKIWANSNTGNIIDSGLLTTSILGTTNFYGTVDFSSTTFINGLNYLPTSASSNYATQQDYNNMRIAMIMGIY